MKKNFFILISILLLVSSCGNSDDENNSNTGIINDTVNTIDGYGETIKDSIEGARDVTNMINDRYDTIESNLPK